MNDFDYCKEIERLVAKVKALEEGSCRFNCRKEKEVFKAGYDARREYKGSASSCAEVAYKQWRKERE